MLWHATVASLLTILPTLVCIRSHKSASQSGQPMDRSVLVRCAFWPALKKAGLRRVKFHSLRHSFASGVIAHGAPVTEVQHLLGHSDPGMTLKVYSHWFKGADSGAASAYTASLFGTDTK
jgi:integrase